MTLLQKKWQFHMKKWKAYLIPVSFESNREFFKLNRFAYRFS